jgi:hypothetical protein
LEEILIMTLTFRTRKYAHGIGFNLDVKIEINKPKSSSQNTKRLKLETSLTAERLFLLKKEGFVDYNQPRILKIKMNKTF